MKKIIITLIVSVLATLIPLFLLDPCLEMNHSGAAIVHVRALSGTVAVTGGDKKGLEQVPTVLYYEFTLDNYSFQIKRYGKNAKLQAEIVPKRNLKTLAETVTGTDIFNNKKQPGLKCRIPSSGDSCRLTAAYVLSRTDENSVLVTPPPEELQALLNEADDAYLVILEDGREISRFDLSGK